MGLFKHVGAKSAQLDLLLNWLPTCGTFVEPFCGTAAVGMAMARMGRCQRLVLADVNARMVCCLRRTKDEATRLIEVVNREGNRYNGAGDEQRWIYADWAATLNGPPGLDRDAAYLLVNRTNFNGLWRENSNGKYNVPWGKRKKVSVDLLVTEIRRAEDALNRVPTDLLVSDYRHLEFPQPVAEALEGATFYVDSPWDETFGAYNAVAWKAEQQAELAMHLRRLAQRGVRVFAHNSDTPRVRALYRGCKLIEVVGKTTVSCTAEGRGAQRELLIEVRA